MSKIAITKFNIKDLRPNLKNAKQEKEYKHLYPDKFTRKEVTFEVSGIHNALANAFRRTLSAEINVKALNADLESFETNDPFILNDFTIETRLRHIPILQSISTDSRYKLEVVNNTEAPMNVKSGMIEVVKGPAKLPFNSNFTLAVLQPGKTLKLPNIYVDTGYGYEFAGYNICSVVSAIPLDIVPIDLETCEGTPAAIADPHQFKFSFVSNGTIEPIELLKNCCTNIVERLKFVEEILPSIETTEDLSILVIAGESDTIGNMLTREIIELYPDIKYVTYSTNSVIRKMTFKLRTNDEPDKVIQNAINTLIKKISSMLSIISKLKA